MPETSATVVACSWMGRVVVVAPAGDEVHLLLQVLKGATLPVGSSVDFDIDELRRKGHGQLQHAQGKAYVAYMGRGSRDCLCTLLLRYQQAGVPERTAQSSVPAELPAFAT